MSGIHENVAGQLHELAVQGVVEESRHRLGRAAAAGREVGPAHVADEQRVPGEDHPRARRGRGVDDEDGHALGRVTRRLEEAQHDRAHTEFVAVADRTMRDRRSRLRAEHHRGPGALGQLTVAAHEVGVEVRLDDVADAQALRLGLGQVLLHVAARIHDRGLALGADQVGRVGQATQIELLEVQARALAGFSDRRRRKARLG